MILKNLFLLTVFFVMYSFTTVSAQTIQFDADELQKSPEDFTTVLTGKGKPGVWVVVKDENAPSQPNALAQTDMDNTNYRFPACVYDPVIAKDADISVKFKPIKGRIDQSGGIIWRYQDKNNYYVVRANALEDNVVMYKLENGKRSDIDPVGSGFFAYGKKANVVTSEWQQLRVVVKGNYFEVYLNDKHLFDVEDDTFTASGKIGLWTKADAYTLFDDLSIDILE